MSKLDTILISAQVMQARFTEILLKHGFNQEMAEQNAKIFTENSVDGVLTHGVNRFPFFVDYVIAGYCIPNATPSLHHKFGGIEQWLGNRGPGPTNAIFATNRSMELAAEFGIGCVALANTSHWIRGGNYGWHAAKKGYAFIGITNTIGAMPAWGAIDVRIGNNPFVMAMPYQDEAIVLDMAMSQYSFGAMELLKYKDEKLPMMGGYNKKGELTNDPAEIIATRRTLPIGYWKGAGMSVLLDIFAAILSAGLAGHEITKSKIETDISQVFISIDLSKLSNHSSIAKALDAIIDDYHQSIPADPSKKITYPGERVLNNRKKNLANGIPVLQKVWDKIMAL